MPLGMQYHSMYYSEDSWDIYWYERNLQGDIVAVYSSSGIKLISYSYDAWGNFTTAYHNTGENSTAVKNPFKYRGYYYDSDLNLYYLNTRYYDPVVGRFISPDSALYHNMFGYNMYAYCYNNPVNYADYTGESAVAAAWLAKLGAFAIIEPTMIGEIIFAVAAAGVIIYSAVTVADVVNEASQSDHYYLSAPVINQSITTESKSNNDTEEITKSQTKSDKTYERKKAAPRIKSKSKKSAREKAFLKGGKTNPIHHPNGKYGPHYHPNNPKFSHWHYYYILIFTIEHQKEQ